MSQDSGSEPLGQGDHVVREGECLSSISEEAGHFWETLWNHPANRQLAEVRDNPNVLLPGDRIKVPPIRLKQEPAAIDEHHRFRRKGVPSRLRLRFQWCNEPRAATPFVLVVAGHRMEGTTDDDGQIDVALPPGATTGQITVGEGSEAQHFALRLGRIPPVGSSAGLRRRLRNLGYDPGTPADEEMLRLAIERFQSDHDLPIDGTLNNTLRAKLQQEHGC